MSKIFKLENGRKIFFPDGKAYRILFDSSDTGAKKIGGLIGVIPAGAKGVGYHYHDNRESILFFLDGEGKALIEGREYDLGPGTVLFVAPKDKHKITNTGRLELRYVEFFTDPPMESDFSEVDHPIAKKRKGEWN